MDIYVGSIPFKWKDKNLLELFSPYGEVNEVKIVIDKITRQNKGFGFVTMEDDAQAKAAIFGLNNSEHEGRNIVVNQSLPKSSLPSKQRQSTTKPKTTDFKSVKHKKALPPWLRKEY